MPDVAEILATERERPGQIGRERHRAIAARIAAARSTPAPRCRLKMVEEGADPRRRVAEQVRAPASAAPEMRNSATRPSMPEQRDFPAATWNALREPVVDRPRQAPRHRPAGAVGSDENSPERKACRLATARPSERRRRGRCRARDNASPARRRRRAAR